MFRSIFKFFIPTFLLFIYSPIFLLFLIDCIQEADIVAYKGEIQEIKTPYFGTQYPNNMDCGWSIRLNTTGMRRPELTFKFTAFDLEESTNCSADYVELRDGTDKTAKLIGNSVHLTCRRIEKSRGESLLLDLFPKDQWMWKAYCRPHCMLIIKYMGEMNRTWN